MKTSYVDVLVRVKVTHGLDEDPAEIANEATFKTTLPHADLRVMDMATAGTCDEANDGILIRDDGGTGRTATINHDPPID